MSDSLREQMLNAGFKETAAPKKKNKRTASSAAHSKNAKRSAHQAGHKSAGHATSGPSSLERENIAKREATAERKRIKAEIKTIIEAEKIEFEKVAVAKAEPEKVESEKADTEKAESEKVKTEQAEPQKAEPEKAEPEKAEPEKIDAIKGMSSHSYVIGKRIKQMFVSDAIREKLVEGSLVITRLNGATFLIPAQTGEKIQALNPEWVVITPSSDNSVDDDDEYADYQVPDDLKW